MAESTHLHCPTWLWSGARAWAQAPFRPQNTKRWHWGGSIRGTEGFWRQNLQILLFEPHLITFNLRIIKSLHHTILSSTLSNNSLTVHFRVISVVHFSCLSHLLCVRQAAPKKWAVGLEFFWQKLVLLLIQSACTMTMWMWRPSPVFVQLLVILFCE